MKNIRNKLTFKALTLREAAREKALALRAKALDTTGEGYVDTAPKSPSFSTPQADGSFCPPPGRGFLPRSVSAVRR